MAGLGRIPRVATALSFAFRDRSSKKGEGLNRFGPARSCLTRKLVPNVEKWYSHTFIGKARARPWVGLSMQGLVLMENALQFVGAFVCFSIAVVSYKGVKQTQSSSLLRLAAAFVFLGTGFLLRGALRLRFVGDHTRIRGLPRDAPHLGALPRDRRATSSSRSRTCST